MDIYIGFRMYTIVTIVFMLISQKSHGMMNESSEIEEMRRVVALCGPKPENTYTGHTRRMGWDTRFLRDGVKGAIYGTVNEKIMYPSLKEYYSYNYEAEYNGNGGGYGRYGRPRDPYFDVYAYSVCPECDALISRIQTATSK